MQIYRWSFVATLLLLVFCTNMHAQEEIPAAGGPLVGNSGSGSYTVGSAVFGTHSSTSGSISSGVQHPYEIAIITGLDHIAGVKLNVSAFPNPVSEYLMINAEDATNRPISFQFYDTKGEILKEGLVNGKQTIISMEDLVPSTYILNLMDDKKAIRSYKIIKH